jgi:hypothetical protein
VLLDRALIDGVAGHVALLSQMTLCQGYGGELTTRARGWSRRVGGAKARLRAQRLM